MKQVGILAVVQVEEWSDAGHIEDNSVVVQLWGRDVAYLETVNMQAGLTEITGQVYVSAELQVGLAETLSVVPVELVGALAGHADLHAG